ncbi:hypothetical protein [Halomarina pelagica]|uniref:hypothetical protein n=1 Tax=Halomarina pelagica TaxID=2961599 RepID=UPI0020C52D69|nr:hypothetical protein [Halomarina sp. BND7]
MNTPQFEQVRNHPSRRPQPVPPIYQPEVAARAVTWAVDHDRDELWVGRSTVESIVANRLFPRRLDRMLAHDAWDAQMTDEPSDADRPDNLFEPVEADFGAHGRFDDRARGTSRTLWATTHRALVAAVGTAAASVLALFAWLLLDWGRRIPVERARRRTARSGTGHTRPAIAGSNTKPRLALAATMSDDRSGESTQTTDHDTIREWAEERDARPASVEGTGGDGDPGVLRFDFEEGADGQDESLEPISWDEFFETFEENDLAMVYQETTNEGETSRFFKFVDRG